MIKIYYSNFINIIAKASKFINKITSNNFLYISRKSFIIIKTREKKAIFL